MTESAKKPIVLVPVDFSPSSEAAMEYASGLATCMHAKLVVLHVVHEPFDTPGYYRKKRGSRRLARMEDLARQMLNEVLEKEARRNPDKQPLQNAKPMVVVGLPAAQILQVVKKIKPVLVIMGSKGRTGLSHLLLGSKAEQVVRLCPVRVTVVKAGQSPS